MLFGNAVCKHRKIILIIALILLIPAILGMNATRINYDILVYLPEKIETVQGEKILSEDFDMGGFSVVILENMKNKDILTLESKIKEINNVEKVICIADVIGTEIPKEMLPNKVQDVLYDKNKTIMLVTFKEQISSDETINSVEKIREITDERCKISGMTATLIDTRNLSDSEVIIYVVIAVVLCLIILQLALDSYFVPFLLLVNIGIAVLYNMGTNIFLGEISYITKAISAVLQLGVTMDFAIFLYHSYMQEKNNFTSKEEAMSNAIRKTFTSVLGSSLTTIAGFLALCSMNLSLGKDIGIVMAKGVLFGVISVVTILPALILECDKIIEKTNSLGVDKLEVYYNSRVLSADVTAGINPEYEEVHDIQNGSMIGCGISVEKYTGSGGKYSASDANASYMSEIMSLFDRNNIMYQIGTLGKIEKGGGGTIAYILADKGCEVVDCGTPVLAMHSPYEVTSKYDVYMTYLAYKAFYKD